MKTSFFIVLLFSIPLMQAGCWNKREAEVPPEPQVSTVQFYPVVAVSPGFLRFQEELGCITNGHVRAFWNLVHPDAFARLSPENRWKLMAELENIEDFTFTGFHYDREEDPAADPLIESLSEENKGGNLYFGMLNCKRKDPDAGRARFGFYLYEKNDLFRILGSRDWQ